MLSTSPDTHQLRPSPAFDERAFDEPPFDEPASMSMMQAYVYKSLRKDDCYVFLAARDDFARLPEPIRIQLGTLQFVFDLALTPDRELARGNAAVVRANLATLGFHVQLPATTLDPMTEDHGTDA